MSIFYANSEVNKLLNKHDYNIFVYYIFVLRDYAEPILEGHKCFMYMSLKRKCNK